MKQRLGWEHTCMHTAQVHMTNLTIYLVHLYTHYIRVIPVTVNASMTQLQPIKQDMPLPVELEELTIS